MAKTRGAAAFLAGELAARRVTKRRGGVVGGVSSSVTTEPLLCELGAVLCWPEESSIVYY